MESHAFLKSEMRIQPLQQFSTSHLSFSPNEFTTHDTFLSKCSVHYEGRKRYALDRGIPNVSSYVSVWNE